MRDILLLVASSRLRRRVALGAISTLCACAPVDPAPDDLDGAFHWLWSHYEDEDAATLSDAVQNLHAASLADSLVEGEPTDGALTDLSEEGAAAVGMGDDVDPSVASGMFLANVFPCTIERLEEIVIELDQMAQYDEAYEAYDRRYDTDVDAYLQRETPIVEWTSDIEATMLGAEYDERVLGQSRWLPAVEGLDPAGPAVVARYWLPEPANFANPDFFFTQDYQLEIYYERGDGLLVHLYAMWRHMGFLEADTDDESIRRIILDNLADWDDRTAELCAS